MNKEITDNTIDTAPLHLSLDHVRDYMATHYYEPLSIEKLASLSGLSPTYFGEAFKKAVGVSTTDYLTALRMRHAKRFCVIRIYCYGISPYRLATMMNFISAGNLRKKSGFRLPPTANFLASKFLRFQWL